MCVSETDLRHEYLLPTESVGKLDGAVLDSLSPGGISTEDLVG